MLTKQLARDLIPLVNDIDKWTLLLEYVNFRRDTLKTRAMIPGTDINAIRGAYDELEILSKLKDHIATDRG